MAQYRQSGSFVNGVTRNGVVASDHHQQQPPLQEPHLSIGVRSGASHKPRHHHRRLKSGGLLKIAITALTAFLLIAFIISVIAFLYLSQNQEINSYHTQDDEVESDTAFPKNVTQTTGVKVLKFGHGSVGHGKDSRYWDRDDRRRDEDYSEEDLLQVQSDSTDNDHVEVKQKNNDKISADRKPHKDLPHRNRGLYNEAIRGELRRYEAEYEASLENIKQLGNPRNKNQLSHDAGIQNQNEMVDTDDEYDDGIDSKDVQMDGYDAVEHDIKNHFDIVKSQDVNDGESRRQDLDEDDESSNDLSTDESFANSQHSDEVDTKLKYSIGLSSKVSSSDRQIGLRKKPRRHRHGSCELKLLNSTSLLVEPLESRKFTRLSLQYTDIEEKPIEDEQWEPRFAGHQSLKEREQSFIAHDQIINCGFVKGLKGSPSTGFELAEDDAKYISTCHIAVVSCIFGNSDRLRSPAGKMVSKLSKKNVCFVMFVDETTLRTLSSEGKIADRTGYIGLWKVVLVKNPPYTDMRRVGKIPKLLTHRLFPSARYSIWLDSKLRLQLDPLLILEYFLWRKGYEYAISNHYDRHCVWEEVAQNKKLNKYNHTVIDEQFTFYRADGLKKFDASDPNKMLPSNVPEGSLIVRAHTPMSNLFSCLWYNEVERFTSRDQLSFAYTYFKLRKTNPEKPFYLNMFKDCERRKIAKLYHHRVEEKEKTSST